MRTYLYLFLLVLVTVPFAVHGQASNNNFVPLQPGIPGVREFATSGSIPELLNNIYKICIGVAATLAVLQIMRAGVMYMGGDSITEKKEARDLISMSVIGLILVLSPVIVFSIINPDILSLRLGAIKLDPVSEQGAQDPFASSANPAAAKAICSQYSGTNLKTIPNPQNLFCNKLPGAGDGWSSVPECCPNLPSGSACCGYSPSNKGAATPPPITSAGTFHYSALVPDSTTKATCSQEFKSSNFTTNTLCVADMNRTIQGGTKAVTLDCSGKTVNTPTTVFNKLSALPVCQ
jgi:type IV secretory pathway VirB2 component (pilin)